MQKRCSKTGSLNRQILFLKASLRPSFFGSRKIDVSKQQGPRACVYPLWSLDSLNYYPNQTKPNISNIRTNGSYRFANLVLTARMDVKGASRKNKMFDSQKRVNTLPTSPSAWFSNIYVSSYSNLQVELCDIIDKLSI